MKVAFIGTGLMGGLMVLRLIDKGFDLTVWNRTVAKTEILKSKGAAIAPSVKQAIEECSVVITMLTDFNAVSEVLSDPKIGYEGKTVIQMSTIAPGESEIIRDKIAGRGGEYLEAPVLGGIAQIPAGKLIPMVGSTRGEFEKWSEFLGNFGEPVHYVGEVGKGAAAKLACNQLIASLVTSFAMSLGYIESLGIVPEEFMGILRPSSYYVPAFDRKLNSMMNRKYTDTNFSLKNLLKDTNLALKEFTDRGINTASLEAVKNILNQGVGSGLANLDYAALYDIVFPKK
jgi:3-hydroxyisobutyrate dehydrogenase